MMMMMMMMMSRRGLKQYDLFKFDLNKILSACMGPL